MGRWRERGERKGSIKKKCFLISHLQSLFDEGLERTYPVTSARKDKVHVSTHGMYLNREWPFLIHPRPSENLRLFFSFIFFLVFFLFFLRFIIVYCCYLHWSPSLLWTFCAVLFEPLAAAAAAADRLIWLVSLNTDERIEFWIISDDQSSEAVCWELTGICSGGGGITWLLVVGSGAIGGWW